MKKLIGLLLLMLPAFCLAQTSANQEIPNDVRVISPTWHYANSVPGLDLPHDLARPVVTIRNYGPKTIKEISYEFLFVDANDGRVWLRYQFENRTTIRAGETKTITNIAQDDRPERGLAPMLPAYRVIINRLKYADGTVWRRR